MTLALFDFDGTISNKDSLLHFTSFAKGKLTFYMGMFCLAPFLILQKLTLLSSQTTKNIFLTWFFKHTGIKSFNSICTQYATEKITSIVLPAAVEKINWHLQNGHRVVVVSASPEDYLQPWCNIMRVECIATRLEKKADKLTGKIDGLNCKGAEKVRRISSMLSITSYAEVYGYGNSSGDKDMLALCTKPFYKILY